MKFNVILKDKFNMDFNKGISMAINFAFVAKLRLRRRFRMETLRRRNRRSGLNLFSCGKILILKFESLQNDYAVGGKEYFNRLTDYVYST